MQCSLSIEKTFVLVYKLMCYAQMLPRGKDDVSLVKACWCMQITIIIQVHIPYQ